MLRTTSLLSVLDNGLSTTFFILMVLSSTDSIREREPTNPSSPTQKETDMGTSDMWILMVKLSVWSTKPEREDSLHEGIISLSLLQN
ncbi:UNVERIFIED_CONTAM: hypothetical protein GTU68_016480 [Idotea baltica]|nr:hypothetical protein [Idotea baltica]